MDPGPSEDSERAVPVRSAASKRARCTRMTSGSWPTLARWPACTDRCGYPAPEVCSHGLRPADLPWAALPAYSNAISGTRPGWPGRSAPSCAGSRSAGHGGSWRTAVRVLLRLPLPALRVLGVDDFALRRRHCYATILIDAETRRRVDVVPERTLPTPSRPGCASTLASRSRQLPGTDPRNVAKALQPGDRSARYEHSLAGPAGGANEVMPRNW